MIEILLNPPDGSKVNFETKGESDKLVKEALPHINIKRSDGTMVVIDIGE